MDKIYGIANQKNVMSIDLPLRLELMNCLPAPWLPTHGLCPAIDLDWTPFQISQRPPPLPYEEDRNTDSQLFPSFDKVIFVFSLTELWRDHISHRLDVSTTELLAYGLVARANPANRVSAELINISDKC